MNIHEEIKLLDPNAKVPTRGSSLAAARDLYSTKSVVILPRQKEIVPTGIAIAWDNPDYYLQILPRSGLAAKHGIDTRAGVIDIDYRKEIFVILQNDSDVPYAIEVGNRIAQCAYIRIENNIETSVISSTENLNTENSKHNDFTIELNSNRQGGFGSTGH